uniref:Uncharacterized protein n=1 Tax=Glossina morsitans morsitans TaxID=37546 RepID=A0A1B0FQP4_GLOMM
MSSGVSDQMKVPGNTAKNEERSIPWSQQVDEVTSYENLTSPINEDSPAANQSTSTQFQYPPFNAKENQNSSWNNYKPRKPTSNFDNKKYNKPAFYNNSKRDDYQLNAWGSNNTRRINSDNAPGIFNRANRYDDGRYENYSSEKLDNRPGTNSAPEEKKASAPPAVSAPKKTTWASIASQPAKLTSRATLTTSSHKKKGPGMPPPPMVPGKHNLDVNTWDLPNNNPPPVPSPPPPIDLGSTDINSDFSPGVGSDFDIGGARNDRGGHYKGQEVLKDNGAKLNYAGNFGRTRGSPNGHSRKNWSTQHPLYQGTRQSGGPPPSGPVRRGEGPAGSGGGSNSGQSRYGERKSHRSGGGQRYFSGGSSFRERNNTHRGNFNSYNEHRRFEGPRSGSGGNDRVDFRDDADRENNEYSGSGSGANRYVSKYDYNRRGDDRGVPKHSNRERDFPEEHQTKNEQSSRLRSGPREIQQQKDNEYPNTERIRDSDY